MIAWKSKEEMVKAFKGDEGSFENDFKVISPHIKGTITKAVMLCSESPDDGEYEVTEFMELLTEGKTSIFNCESHLGEECYRLYLIEEEHFTDFNGKNGKKCWLGKYILTKECWFRKYILTMDIPGMSTLIIMETERRLK